MLEMSPRHRVPARFSPRVSPDWPPPVAHRLRETLIQLWMQKNVVLGMLQGLHVPGCREVTCTHLPTPSPLGPTATLQPMSPQALWEDGVSEGNLPLPFERVLHEEILDSDQEHSLIPLSGQAPRPLPAHPDKLLTSCCRQLSRAARRQHQIQYKLPWRG